MHRFYDWKQSQQRDDLEIGVFVGPSFDYDIETLKGVARLRERRGGKFQILNLGAAHGLSRTLPTHRLRDYWRFGGV